MPETGVVDSETGRLQVTRVEVVSQFCRELGRRQWCVFRKDHGASCNHLLSCAFLSDLPSLFTAILLIDGPADLILCVSAADVSLC